jgi:hypothetical protein
MTTLPEKGQRQHVDELGLDSAARFCLGPITTRARAVPYVQWTSRGALVVMDGPTPTHLAS